MRILGIDMGSKRIGVAVSDELGITAQAVTTIKRKNKKEDLAAV
ncbi:MAG: Holliday junction resolvase RuvX, partial [Thermacetogeniaceae bacterium]